MKNTILSMFVSVFAIAGSASAYTGGDFPTANAAFGQANLTSGSPDDMSYPESVVVDSAGQRLFVADFDNNQVLVYALSSPSAPSGSIGGGACAVSDANLCGPADLAYDADSGLLWIADSNNHRVVAWDTSSSAFSYVLGQPDFDTNTSGQGCSGALSAAYDRDACTTLFPIALAVEYESRLFVGGYDSVRVFPISTLGNHTAATGVLGQANLTTTWTPDYNPTWTASVVTVVTDLELTGSTLLVGSAAFTPTSTGRITAFDVATVTNNEAAFAVIGQSSLTAKSVSAASATSLGYPAGVHVRANDLFVADRTNNRVLVFNVNDLGTTLPAADNVIGQPSFTSTDVSADCTTGTASTTNACGLNAPTGVGTKAPGGGSGGLRVYVVDKFQHRVLQFQ